MASFASLVGEAEMPVSSVWAALLRMAVRASHRGVSSLQRKRGRLVLRERKSGRMETGHGVTVLAAIAAWSTSKLPAMRIAMAIETGLVRGMVVRIQAGRLMALGAGDGLVLPVQRISGRPVAGLRERGRLPTGDRVTGAALSVIGTTLELALVFVLMAIHSPFVGDRGLEIGILVALHAGQALMLSVQRELSLAMIERGGEPDLAPGFRVVAGLAAGRKRAVMRVLMAAVTLGKIQPGVLHDFGVRFRRAMALCALHAAVLSGERKMRGGVVERAHRLPVPRIMTALAVASQLSRVTVFVTREARGMQSLKGVVQVLGQDALAVTFGDVPRIVALLALQLGVAAFQSVAGALVVELVFRGGPLIDAEVLAVVLRVASGAIHVSFRAVHVPAVIAFPLCHQVFDFCMTRQAA